MAFYFVSTFANAQTPTKQRPYGYRGLKIITSLRLRFPDFQRVPMIGQTNRVYEILNRKRQLTLPMINRGVAIFAKACFGHPSPSKRQKLNATANAFGAPIRPRHHVPTQQGVGT
ncbi:hypothetical protein BPLS_P0152 [Bathymodiolus platifrons methanotrophic gill symbiont]|nr:hypothetical protein BPLS_P0152 [Bathymodiolus platifrons methanotrophic gill symbiont]